MGLDQAEGLGDENLVLEFKELLGDIYLTKRDYKKAVSNYYSILSYGDRNRNNDRRIDGFYFLANVYKAMGAYNKASDYYKEVLVLYDKKQNLKGRAKVLSALGDNYAISNQSNNAIEVYEKLLKLALTDKQYSYVGKAHEMLFKEYIVAKNSQKAIEFGTLYFERIKDKGDKRRKADAANMLSRQYLNVGKGKEALSYAELAIKNNGDVTEYYSSLGLALAATGNHSKAMASFEEAIEQYEQKRQTSSIADVYNEMAQVSYDKKDYRSTLSFLDKAERIAKSRNSKETLLETYRLLNLVHTKKGAMALAADYKKQYEAVKLQVGESGKYRPKISQSKENLAESYEQQAKALLSNIENQRLAEEQEKLKSEQKIKQLEYENQQSRLKAIELEQKALEAERVQQDLLLAEQNYEALEREKRLKELEVEKENISLREKEREKQLEIARQQQQILEQQKEFEAKEAEQAKLIQYVIIGASVLVLAILGVAFYRTINTNKTISEQNQNLAEQQKTILNRNIQLKKSSEAMLAMNNKLKKAHLNLKVILEKEQETKKELEKANQEIKNTQVHLVQAEKMSSLGLLTAGIAHEINNPINFVSSGVQSLLRNFEELSVFIANYQKVLGLDDLAEIKKYAAILQEDEDALTDLQSSSEELLEDVNYGINRITEIVNGLRSFSRHDEAEVKDADINESFNSALLILKNKSKDKAHIELHLDDSLPQIQCFPGQINQVFVNLINNALDAIDGQEGVITIYTKDLDEDWIEVRVQDNGSGMPDDVKDKIFDPFFTTKDIGKGTGLGLSISHGIIEKHNGEIRVESEIGVGTTFIIKLPKKLEVDEKVLEDQLL
ncbi:ATP-binding protein [Reichenbachiella versicolor]|uniref:ATP-binding protein n=1 Tax=Reichenbachiella versicolor TaxID=1821036 RepID=UPI0013A558E6|nr:ATP-binding protein [Reichenbachiella versicolor]